MDLTLDCVHSMLLSVRTTLKVSATFQLALQLKKISQCVSDFCGDIGGVVIIMSMMLSLDQKLRLLFNRACTRFE